MDLRVYYRKVREVESTLPGPFVVIVSLETSDGGKAGVRSEVIRLSAARQIAEGRARIATFDETNDFHAHNREIKRAADENAAFNRMQVMVVPARPAVKSPKD